MEQHEPPVELAVEREAEQVGLELLQVFHVAHAVLCARRLLGKILQSPERFLDSVEQLEVPTQLLVACELCCVDLLLELPHC